MKKILYIFTILSFVFILNACDFITSDVTPNNPDTVTDQSLGIASHDTIYQLQVYAFNDSDGDGLGDFKGIADKAAYLSWLGIDAVWLSPIHPSPSYHHYDVTNYYMADPAYEVDGFTFEHMLDVLNSYGIDVILDIVVNHSSVDHPFFLSAVNAFKTGQESPYIDYYLLSETPFTHPTLGYTSAVIDGVYYDAFYGFSHMPAFNFDHEPVREMFVDIFSYWLDKGVAGFRLDAAKHVYDDYTKNNDLFAYFVETLETTYDDVYFVNEIWDAQNNVAPYFASGMSNFNFDTRNIIAQAINGNRNYGQFLEDYQTLIRSYNTSAIESPFISNHDIGRLGIGYSEQQQIMMAALNILSPGNSYIYYGDEIMLQGTRTMVQGSSGYEDAALRTPMLWDEWTYYFADYISDTTPAIASAETISRLTVEAAMADTSSILHAHKALIELKASLPLFSSGHVTSVFMDENLISYQISDETNHMLVIHNLNGQAFSVSNETFHSIIGQYSQSSDATLTNNTLSIPAYSHIIVELSAPIDTSQTTMESNAFVMGPFSSWVTSAQYMMSENNGTYTFTLTLTEENQMKVFIDDTWYGFSNVESANGIAIRQEETYDNIILPAGTYLITFKDGFITINDA